MTSAAINYVAFLGDHLPTQCGIATSRTERSSAHESAAFDESRDALRVRSICAYPPLILKIFSLSHLIEFAARLPHPNKADKAEAGYANVLRLPLPGWDAVR